MHRLLHYQTVQMVVLQSLQQIYSVMLSCNSCWEACQEVLGGVATHVIKNGF